MSEFRIKFITKDGSLIQNRTSDSSWYFRHNIFDKETAEEFMKTDAREKGVRIVSYSYDNNGITAIVEFLSTLKKKKK